MTRFNIASFNVKNLIGPEREYYKFQKYTAEEYAWKKDWTADQLLTMNTDIVCFQEIFEEEALRDVIAEADRRGELSNKASIPDKSKGYHKKAIFRKLGYTPYTSSELAFAPNVNDGAPGQRRPGLAILSRFGFSAAPEIIQHLSDPVTIPFQELDGGEAGSYTITRLSRPVLKVKVPVGSTTLTIFNCHLKSKLGEFIRPADAEFAPEADLTRLDPAGRAIGAMRAAVRRMAEAWVLRRAILEELSANNPVIVTGDFNDGEHAVSSEIISGERPFKNYTWMLRHDAKSADDRYTKTENKQITGGLEAVKLVSAEKMFVRKSLRDMVYTSAFGGVYESIDQIYMSRHFLPDFDKSIAEMEYFSVLNDHLTDGSHAEAPYNKLASDHGQIIAHMRMKRK